MSDDPRYLAIRSELERLQSFQLRRILYTDPGDMVCDTYAFDGKRYCPMAIGLGISDHGPVMSDDFARTLIARRLGHPMKSTSGIPGKFYTTDREADIRRVCREILDGRGE